MMLKNINQRTNYTYMYANPTQAKKKYIIFFNRRSISPKLGLMSKYGRGTVSGGLSYR